MAQYCMNVYDCVELHKYVLEHIFTHYHCGLVHTVYLLGSEILGWLIIPIVFIRIFFLGGGP